MSIPSPVDILTLLTYALDENREARELLRVSHAGLAYRPLGWRRVGPVLRTREGFAAGLAVQYLGENLDRARDHWQAGLGFLAELFAADGANEPVRRLADDLRQAGLDEILSQLGDDAVPRQRKQAAAHFAAVLNRMSECDRIVGGARSRLVLQRMRNEES